MKKYDLALVALYIVIIIAVVNILDREQKWYGALLSQSSAITENQAIKAVVISNSDCSLDIYSLSQTAPEGRTWAIRGSFDYEYLDNISIEDETLRIDGVGKGKLSAVIKLSDSLRLEIINSPNVRILTDEEFAEKLTQNPNKYDF